MSRVFFTNQIMLVAVAGYYRLPVTGGLNYIRVFLLLFLSISISNRVTGSNPLRKYATRHNFSELPRVTGVTAIERKEQ
jgi:hypothetical protein